jgi:hypothetical protein
MVKSVALSGHCQAAISTGAQAEISESCQGMSEPVAPIRLESVPP